jgi:hypothetical protein
LVATVNSNTRENDMKHAVDTALDRPTGLRRQLLRGAWGMLVICLGIEANAATVYLCKAYSGGTFWSNTVCSQQKALIDRMVTVPDGMSWEQQVQLAEQSRAEAARLTAPPPVTVTSTERHFYNGVEGKTGECQSLAASIAQYDAMARQPQPGQMQDWITARKREARDRQFKLRC